jgi:hypothetical protein
VTIPVNRVRSVGAAKTAALEKEIESLADFPSGKPGRALALKPKPAQFTRGTLFNLLGSAKLADRAKLIPVLLAYLRREVPAVFSKVPLHPLDFGFRKVEELVQFLAEKVYVIETSAKSVREFAREEYLAGLRWNLVGKVLFERLVKYNARVGRLVLEWADEFREAMVNSEIRKRGFLWMLDVNDGRRKVTALFRKPQKVIEFRLEGGKSVRPEFTDFGTMAENSAGDVLLTPIEIKLPSAMSGAKIQQAQFKDRLADADTLVAVLEDGSERRIDPGRVVFDEESTHHIAITLYSKRRWEAEGLNPIDKNGKRLFDVDPVRELKPVSNPRTGTIYYALRLTVLRDWLVDLVKLVTDPQAK